MSYKLSACTVSLRFSRSTSKYFPFLIKNPSLERPILNLSLLHFPRKCLKNIFNLIASFGTNFHKLNSMAACQISSFFDGDTAILIEILFCGDEDLADSIRGMIFYLYYPFLDVFERLCVVG